MSHTCYGFSILMKGSQDEEEIKFFLGLQTRLLKAEFFINQSTKEIRAHGSQRNAYSNEPFCQI